ncbi:MAG TPA: ORF6N domain-containing protein [Nitrospirae bacterium]|nr:ORF6N domain-containing protein [Nitrospirota bacterium]
MLDTDLADLYGVTVKRLNEQVKRNLNRFPPDFMFQLNEEEHQSLRSHFATSKKGRGRHRKYLPYVFTEHGTIMLANISKSKTHKRFL